MIILRFAFFLRNVLHELSKLNYIFNNYHTAKIRC